MLFPKRSHSRLPSKHIFCGDATQVTGEEGMYVFIYGAVKKPGVYEIQKGARLYELVSLAGGLSQEAAIGYNNLAREIVDGEQIYVPTEEEVKGGQGAGGVVGAGDGGVVGVGDGGGYQNEKRINRNSFYFRQKRFYEWVGGRYHWRI